MQMQNNTQVQGIQSSIVYQRKCESFIKPKSVKNYLFTYILVNIN
jgi:hypothetical protein